MAKPASELEFKEAMLVRLGHPVIKINVADQHIEAAMEEAINRFVAHHRDGSVDVYYALTFTEEDITNGYILIPEQIEEIKEVVPKGFGVGNFTTESWQYLNQLLNRQNSMAPMTMADYVIARQAVKNISSILGSGNKPYIFERFSRKFRPLFGVAAGEIVCVKGAQNVDPRIEGNEGAWGDRWLLAYAAACLKRIWGGILKKADGVALPGGVTLNGKDIFDEAIEEISLLEERLIAEESEPLGIFMG